MTTTRQMDEARRALRHFTRIHPATITSRPIKVRRITHFVEQNFLKKMYTRRKSNLGVWIKSWINLAGIFLSESSQVVMKPGWLVKGSPLEERADSTKSPYKQIRLQKVCVNPENELSKSCKQLKKLPFSCTFIEDARIVVERK